MTSEVSEKPDVGEEHDVGEEPDVGEEEQIIEEVIDSMTEPVEWMGNTEVEGAQEEYYNQDELIEDTIVGFDDSDAYQSFLPIRDGIPVLSLNLPDLISRSVPFGNDRLVHCFNKKCQRQIAFDGYLYTVKDYLSEAQWNNWKCVNSVCFGEIRTTPDMRELRICSEHVSTCLPDELQIRVRIAVYDLRLLTEFTDHSMQTLYDGAIERLKTEYPDAVEIFPSFEVLKATLDDHRINKIYRKRFEMQNLRDKQRKLNMTPDEVVYTENASGLIKFRRTKPFPPSICIECNDQLMTDNLPSQDNLIAHYMYTHGKRMTIERFEFKDINQFDQYLRELNVVSRHKLRRMGLADENMYYLCGHDDRLSKSGVGRATRMQQQNCHCTAFLRIFDWRIVSKRETSRIVVDYCLEHQMHPHDDNILPSRDEIDYYTPEVFLRDMDDRKSRGMKMLELGVRPKRMIEMRHFSNTARLRPVFGVRALAPPLAAQLAAGNNTPFVDDYDEHQHRNRAKTRQSIRTAYPRQEESKPIVSSPLEQLPAQPVSSEPQRLFMSPSKQPYGRLTERQNFREIYTFNAVCKLEDAAISLLNKLQSCQNTRVAIGYKEKIMAILKAANQDAALQEGAGPETDSWVLAKPGRGRPKKRKIRDIAGEEDEEEEVETVGAGELEEDVDVEIEEEHVEMPMEMPICSEAPPPKEPSPTPPPAKKEKATPLPAPNSKSEEKEEPPVSPVPSTSSPAPPPPDTLTRSGRQRKLPARLIE